MRFRRGLAALALPLVLVTGCGDDSTTTADDPAASQGTTTSAAPSETVTSAPTDPPVPTEPECSTVWVAEATLPAGYAGCTQAGALVEPDVLACSSGQSLVRHDNRFYGVRGGTIHASKDLQKDPDYLHSIAVCRG